MIIVGAKGFAKEVLEIVTLSMTSNQVVFFDDINSYQRPLLFGTYAILKSEQEAIDYFKTKDSRFTIGIGSPSLRKRMYEKFTNIGGKLTSTISTLATIGSQEVNIGEGTNILPGAIISNSVATGLGCIIYYNAILTHDVIIGDFVEISPSVTLLGRCHIGNYTQLGANSTILTDITIGNNVVVAAGAVVTKNVPDNCMVAGVPASIKKQMTPLNF